MVALCIQCLPVASMAAFYGQYVSFLLLPLEITTNAVA